VRERLVDGLIRRYGHASTEHVTCGTAVDTCAILCEADGVTASRLDAPLR
jgi:glucokinase